jgi:hypothetical protein
VSSACLAADPREVSLAPGSGGSSIAHLRSLNLTPGFAGSIALGDLLSSLSARTAL